MLAVLCLQRKKNLNLVVFEEGVIKGWLLRDGYTVNDITIWALFKNNLFSK